MHAMEIPCLALAREYGCLLGNINYVSACIYELSTVHILLHSILRTVLRTLSALPYPFSPLRSASPRGPISHVSLLQNILGPTGGPGPDGSRNGLRFELCA